MIRRRPMGRPRFKTTAEYRRYVRAEERQLDRDISKYKAESEAGQRRIDLAFIEWVKEQRAKFTPEELARIDEEDRQRTIESIAKAKRRAEERLEAQRSDTRGT